MQYQHIIKIIIIKELNESQNALYYHFHRKCSYIMTEYLKTKMENIISTGGSNVSMNLNVVVAKHKVSHIYLRE